MGAACPHWLALMVANRPIGRIRVKLRMLCSAIPETSEYRIKIDQARQSDLIALEETQRYAGIMVFIDFLSYFVPGLAPADVPVALHGPNPDRYPTGNEHDYTFTLPDGRKLGYAQYGAMTGKPILFFHGLPACRIEGAYFHQLGLKHGARIIATDRPGLGLSSPHPGRTLLDYPKDIEKLVEYLDLKEYAVMVGTIHECLVPWRN